MRMKIMILGLSIVVLTVATFSVLAQKEIDPARDAFYTTNPVWSHDGTKIAKVEGNTVQIWDIATKTLQLTFNGHQDKIYSLAWHPDGTQLATSSRDEKLLIWNTTTGEIIQNIAEPSWLIHLDWSPDGQSIAGTGETGTYVWDTATGELKGQYQGNVSSDVAFSPNGTAYAFLVNREIVLLDGSSFLITGGMGDLDDWNNNMNSVAWSPDGKRLVTGSLQGGVYVWEVGTSSLPVYRLVGNDRYGQIFPLSSGYREIALAWAKAVSFTPDGNRVQSASGDGTVRQWDLATGRLVMESYIPPNRTAAWSPYGGRLAYQGLSDESLESGFALTDNQHQITVPLASLDLVKSIAGGCITEADGIRSSLDTLTTDALPDFITQVKALPMDAIPTACAADLIAVAEALIAQ